MADTGIKTSAELGYEVRDTNLKAVVVFGVSLVAITLACLGATAGVITYFASSAAKAQAPLTPMSTLGKQELPAEPRLLTTEPQTLAEFRAAEKKQLETYGWVDRGSGVVRIPVERAMALVAREGLPPTP